MAKREPLLWFKFEDHSDRPWFVYLADEHMVSSLRGSYGITFHSTREIFLHVAQSKEELSSTIHHELMHVALGPRKDQRRRYEMTIRRAERVMKCCMRWPWPALPRGYRSLAQKARRRESDV